MNISRTALRASLPCVLLLAACGTSPLAPIQAPKPFNVDTEGWNVMHEKASVDLACPIEKLHTRKLNETSATYGVIDSFEISGCGATEISCIRSLSSGLATAWSVYSDEDLRKKVRFSFGNRCPDLSVEFIDHGTRGVTACEQKIVYVMTSSGWIANTETKTGDEEPN